VLSGRTITVSGGRTRFRGESTTTRRVFVISGGWNGVANGASNAHHSTSPGLGENCSAIPRSMTPCSASSMAHWTPKTTQNCDLAARCLH
jgi:hypothetical protein